MSAIGLERIELERLRDRVGRLFAALQEAAEGFAPPAPGAWSPPVDLCEADDCIFARIELPGVTAEQIKLTLTGERLTVCGEKKRRTPRRGMSYLRSERTYGRFNRVVPLRWPINVREATAELRSGVLLVRLPKLKDRRGAEFKIPIKEVTSDEKKDMISKS